MTYEQNYSELKQMERDFIKMRKAYLNNEDNNAHTKNAQMLVNYFGTDEEKAAMNNIAYNHKKRGHILIEEVKQRSELSSKYYKQLFYTELTQKNRPLSNS